MKCIKLFTVLLFAALAQSASARDGYHLTLKFTDIKDSVVYLAHYFGKPLPTIYKLDSARFDKKGIATFDGKEPITGGLYLLLYDNKQKYFEFLLDNGNDMNITATSKDLPIGNKFKNSPENDRYVQFITEMKGFNDKQQVLQTEMKNAKNSIDSTAVRNKMVALNNDVKQHSTQYVKNNPNTLFAKILAASQEPDVPQGKHYFADGTLDSNFAYTYYKAHYWDQFDLGDNRMINTQLYDGKLDEYINKLVLPYPDSMEKEADMLLSRTRGAKDMFHYTLWWLTRNAENSKIMGMDQVFVYLVENYYMKGDAFWLSSEELAKYQDRASKIAPNVIGNIAPEIKMPDVNGKMQSLSAIQAPYTLVVFWEPTCGHCQHELPLIDSVYRAALQKKGMKIFAVKTSAEEAEDKWKEFIKKNHIEDWVHVHDPERQSDFRSKYDVYSTPTIYLLDGKKIIRGKRIDHSNILQIVEMLEKKEKLTKKA